VFEHLDSLGRHRPSDRGMPVDTSAMVTWGQRTLVVDEPRELAAALAGDCEVQTCFARHWLEEAVDLLPGRLEPRFVDEVAGAFAAQGFSLRGLLLAIVQSRAFLDP
jgi:hypothetical protein